MDSLSFAHFHRAVREQVLIDERVDPFNKDDGGWNSDIVAPADFLSKKDFIQYLFISVLSRKPNDQELTTLTTLTKDAKPRGVAMITFDYFSRLPELYFQTAH